MVLVHLGLVLVLLVHVHSLLVSSLLIVLSPQTNDFLKGDLAYFEVETLISEGATVEWDTTAQAPYLYKGSTWVSYDNPRYYFTQHRNVQYLMYGNGRSFAAKAQLVKNYNLRGIFVWDIDEDDNNALINSAVATFNSTTN